MNSKNNLTLNELISLYEVSNEAEGKSTKTVVWYREMLRQFITYLTAQQHPADLSTFSIETVRKYIIFLRHKPKFKDHPYTPPQSTPLSPKTLQCHIRVLKAFSSWLYIEEYTITNRLKNLKLPKAPVTIIEPLTPEEINSINASINLKSPCGERNNAIFNTLLDTGLRVSEEVDISLNNLNLVDGFIKVMGKGAKERIVPIGKYVQSILRSYINENRPKPIDASCNKLFLSVGGKPITVNTIKLLFSKLSKTSGVTRLHAHLCRHTFAINYLLNGGDIFSLKEILGHSSMEMVNHYLHFTSTQITAQHRKYSPVDKLHELSTMNALQVLHAKMSP